MIAFLSVVVAMTVVAVDLTGNILKHNIGTMYKLKEATNIREGDNLNKENFWNIAEEIYPNVIKLFYAWIDEYKKILFPVREYNKSFNWDPFFGNIWPTAQNIKFHHLPIEMQVGIIFRFIREKKREISKVIGPSRMSGFAAYEVSGWLDIIISAFDSLEIDIKRNGKI